MNAFVLDLLILLVMHLILESVKFFWEEPWSSLLPRTELTTRFMNDELSFA